MKTQIIATAFAIVLSMSLNNAEASNGNNMNPTTSESNPIEMTVSETMASAEEEISIEAWMVDEGLWKLNKESSKSTERVETEEPLKIESWMHSDVYFRISNDSYNNIESWMVDQNLWRY